MKEKAILVGLDRGKPGEDFEQSMKELALLADTAGAQVLDCVVQKRNVANRAYYFGRGKLDELSALSAHYEADLLIFNDELTPTQLRNIDRLMEAKVIDRSALILDIFARRALSREGKLQVETAQMNYLLPRLAGIGSTLSKLGGGIGTRGPGETQLELDRRVVRRRIADLKQEISALRKHRALHRHKRKRNSCTVISLVGYTNAGKSTLLNTLTGAAAHTEDKLFATLDPMVRRGRVDENREALFTDTVGFIEKLPRQLVAAFQATLEEVAAADILLHVVDISHPDYLNHLSVVRLQLEEIDPACSRREILVFNKIDLLQDTVRMNFLRREFPGSSFISALDRSGLDDLIKRISDFMTRWRSTVKLCLPYREGRLIAEMQKEGRIEKMEYGEKGLLLTAAVEPELAGRLKPFMVDGGDSFLEND